MRLQPPPSSHFEALQHLSAVTRSSVPGLVRKLVISSSRTSIKVDKLPKSSSVTVPKRPLQEHGQGRCFQALKLPTHDLHRTAQNIVAAQHQVPAPATGRLAPCCVLHCTEACFHRIARSQGMRTALTLHNCFSPHLAAGGPPTDKQRRPSRWPCSPQCLLPSTGQHVARIGGLSRSVGNRPPPRGEATWPGEDETLASAKHTRRRAQPTRRWAQQ